MPRRPYPSQVQDRFMLRLPDGMRGQIASAAKQNNRSMNAEIVRRLEASFASQKMTVDAISRQNEFLSRLGEVMHEIKEYRLKVEQQAEGLAKLAETYLERAERAERELKKRKRRP